jgi:hypothetical protein
MSSPKLKQKSSHQAKSTHSGHRTIRFLLLLAGLFVLSVYGWLRFQQSLSLWKILIQIEVWPGPLYLAISGAAWGLMGLIAVLALFFRLTWAIQYTKVIVLLMAAWYWFDRLVLVQSEAARTNLVFMALLTILAVIYTFAVLRSLQRNKKHVLSSQVDEC